jgi:D-3-phosphoglycerate dehydrogenase
MIEPKQGCVYRVLVSDDMEMLDGIEAELHERADADLDVTITSVTDEDELVEAASDADALVAGAHTPVTQSVLEAVGLDLVARAGVGVDNVDLDAARETGTTVTNTPDYCTEEVATHALSLLLACSRRLSTYDRQTRGGGWDWETARAPRRLSEATLGCVGFGAIARTMAEQANGIVGETLAYDPYVDADTAAKHGGIAVDFEELTARSELLVVFAPLTPETRELIDGDVLAQLPNDAIVVNVGRGSVVDDEALAAALDDGPVAAAGLDVLPTEPPRDSPLVGRDDVLVTPHSGWYSVEARADLLASVANAVGRVASGEAPDDHVTVST